MSWNLHAREFVPGGGAPPMAMGMGNPMPMAPPPMPVPTTGGLKAEAPAFVPGSSFLQATAAPFVPGGGGGNPAPMLSMRPNAPPFVAPAAAEPIKQMLPPDYGHTYVFGDQAWVTAHTVGKIYPLPRQANQGKSWTNWFTGRIVSLGPLSNRSGLQYMYGSLNDHLRNAPQTHGGVMCLRDDLTDLLTPQEPTALWSLLRQSGYVIALNTLADPAQEWNNLCNLYNARAPPLDDRPFYSSPPQPILGCGAFYVRQTCFMFVVTSSNSPNVSYTPLEEDELRSVLGPGMTKRIFSVSSILPFVLNDAQHCPLSSMLWLSAGGASPTDAASSQAKRLGIEKAFQQRVPTTVQSTINHLVNPDAPSSAAGSSTSTPATVAVTAATATAGFPSSAVTTTAAVAPVPVVRIVDGIALDDIKGAEEIILQALRHLLTPATPQIATSQMGRPALIVFRIVPSKRSGPGGACLSSFDADRLRLLLLLLAEFALFPQANVMIDTAPATQRALELLSTTAPLTDFDMTTSPSVGAVLPCVDKEIFDVSAPISPTPEGGAPVVTAPRQEALAFIHSVWQTVQPPKSVLAVAAEKHMTPKSFFGFGTASIADLIHVREAVQHKLSSIYVAHAGHPTERLSRRNYVSTLVAFASQSAVQLPPTPHHFNHTIPLSSHVGYRMPVGTRALLVMDINYRMFCLDQRALELNLKPNLMGSSKEDQAALLSAAIASMFEVPPWAWCSQQFPPRDRGFTILDGTLTACNAYSPGTVANRLPAPCAQQYKLIIHDVLVWNGDQIALKPDWTYLHRMSLIMNIPVALLQKLSPAKTLPAGVQLEDDREACVPFPSSLEFYQMLPTVQHYISNAAGQQNSKFRRHNSLLGFAVIRSQLHFSPISAFETLQMMKQTGVVVGDFASEGGMAFVATAALPYGQHPTLTWVPPEGQTVLFAVKSITLKDLTMKSISENTILSAWLQSEPVAAKDPSTPPGEGTPMDSASVSIASPLTDSDRERREQLKAALSRLVSVLQSPQDVPAIPNFRRVLHEILRLLKHSLAQFQLGVQSGPTVSAATGVSLSSALTSQATPPPMYAPFQNEFAEGTIEELLATDDGDDVMPAPETALTAEEKQLLSPEATTVMSRVLRHFMDCVAGPTAAAAPTGLLIECLLRRDVDGAHWWDPVALWPEEKSMECSTFASICRRHTDVVNNASVTVGTDVASYNSSRGTANAVSFKNPVATFAEAISLVADPALTEDEFNFMCQATRFVCAECQTINDRGSLSSPDPSMQSPPQYYCNRCWAKYGQGECALCSGGSGKIRNGRIDSLASDHFYCEDCWRSAWIALSTVEDPALRQKLFVSPMLLQAFASTVPIPPPSSKDIVLTYGAAGVDGNSNKTRLRLIADTTISGAFQAFSDRQVLRCPFTSEYKQQLLQQREAFTPSLHAAQYLRVAQRRSLNDIARSFLFVQPPWTTVRVLDLCTGTSPDSALWTWISDCHSPVGPAKGKGASNGHAAAPPGTTDVVGAATTMLLSSIPRVQYVGVDLSVMTADAANRWVRRSLCAKSSKSTSSQATSVVACADAASPQLWLSHLNRLFDTDSRSSSSTCNQQVNVVTCLRPTAFHSLVKTPNMLHQFMQRVAEGLVPGGTFVATCIDVAGLKCGAGGQQSIVLGDGHVKVSFLADSIWSETQLPVVTHGAPLNITVDRTPKRQLPTSWAEPSTFFTAKDVLGPNAAEGGTSPLMPCNTEVTRDLPGVSIDLILQAAASVGLHLDTTESGSAFDLAQKATQAAKDALLVEDELNGLKSTNGSTSTPSKSGNAASSSSTYAKSVAAAIYQSLTAAASAHPTSEDDGGKSEPTIPPMALLKPFEATWLKMHRVLVFRRECIAKPIDTDLQQGVHAFLEAMSGAHNQPPVASPVSQDSGYPMPTTSAGASNGSSVPSEQGYDMPMMTTNNNNNNMMSNNRGGYGNAGPPMLPGPLHSSNGGGNNNNSNNNGFYPTTGKPIPPAPVATPASLPRPRSQQHVNDESVAPPMGGRNKAPPPPFSAATAPTGGPSGRGAPSNRGGDFYQWEDEEQQGRNGQRGNNGGNSNAPAYRQPQQGGGRHHR